MDKRTLLPFVSTLCVALILSSPSASLSEDVLICGIEPMYMAGDVCLERVYQTLGSSFHYLIPAVHGGFPQSSFSTLSIPDVIFQHPVALVQFAWNVFQVCRFLLCSCTM
jgi:hypothetical protein